MTVRDVYETVYERDARYQIEDTCSQGYLGGLYAQSQCGGGTDGGDESRHYEDYIVIDLASGEMLPGEKAYHGGSESDEHGPDVSSEEPAK